MVATIIVNDSFTCSPLSFGVQLGDEFLVPRQEHLVDGPLSLKLILKTLSLKIHLKRCS
jgi:hypothetical protein